MHVVLDEQDRDALGRELAEQHRELLGLVLVLTRRGLVEEQHLRPRGQAASELDQPALTGRQRVDARVGDVLQPDALDDLLDDGGRAAAVTRVALADVGGDPDVLAHGQHVEQLEPLERAGEPEPGPLGRVQLRDVTAVEDDPARRSAGAAR